MESLPQKFGRYFTTHTVRQVTKWELGRQEFQGENSTNFPFDQMIRGMHVGSSHHNQGEVLWILYGDHPEDNKGRSLKAAAILARVSGPTRSKAQ